MSKDLETAAVDYNPFERHGELERTAPATEGQTEIWTALSLSPDANLAYNQSILVSIPKLLDETSLQHAFDLLLKTHDALRMAFSPLGRTLYITHKSFSPLETHDIRSLNEDAKAQHLAELRKAATQTPFVLDQAPLVRLVAIRMSDCDTRLILSAHHLVTDGWSLAVLLTDLAAAYNNGRLEAAPSFANFAEGEARLALASEKTPAQKYWTDRFQDGGSILELPIEAQRPALRTFASLRTDRELPQDLVRGLKAIAKQYQASYVAVQLAAFAILLSRLCQQSDITIGMPLAGQASLGLTRMVGHAVRLLPLRILLNEQETFAELVLGLKGQLLDAYEHQNFTFGEVLKALPIERDPSRIPLVSVMFNVDTKLEAHELVFGGAQATYDNNPRYAENFELFINISESSQETLMECQYNTSLFSPSRIKTLLDTYLHLMRSLVSAPESAYARAPLWDLEADVRKQCSETSFAYDINLSLVDLLRDAAVRHGETLALESEDGSLSYTELWSASDRLKNELIASGVKPRSRIGLCLSRSTRMITAQLAILRAGASYVPLDPSFPQERIRFMIDDAQMDLIISERSTLGILEGKEKTLIWEGRQPAQESPDRKVSSSDPAYMIYTSGSTGKPKAVLIGHQSVVNFLLSMRDRLDFKADTRLLAVTTLSFDIAVLEIFMPLISGSTIVLAGDAVCKDGFLLRKRLESSGITMMQATPSTWRMLLSVDWKPSKDLTLLSGGEAFPADLKSELKSAKEVWNLYGPTEATVWITAKRMSEIASHDAITVGRPIGNTRLYILDRNLQALPPGVKGEVYIAGDSLAEGYWQRPDLDKEKFLPSLEGQGRMYQTGDIGRFTAKGELEILGRVDAQIKLRGYRIELGEIEDSILQAEGVRAATVLLHEAKGGLSQIVAYLVWSQGARMKDLRDRLTQSLPDYMIPQTFVELTALPLLPNGKINRKALPEPDSIASEMAGNESHWEGPIAEIAKLWCQTLGRPSIEAHDNFFLSGGHSLLAIQLIAQLNKLVGTELTLRDIFQYPKFKAFAHHALASSPKSLSAVAKATVPVLSLAQERMWYLEQLGVGALHNIPGVWMIHGEYQHEPWLKALTALGQQHDVLGLAVRLENGAPMPFQKGYVDLPCPFVDYSQVADAEVKAMTELANEAESVMNIEQAPLIYFKMYKLAENKHLFSIRVHHFIWDGWSFDLFWSHMNTLYSQALKGQLQAMAPLSPNYADFSAWQRSRVETKGESHRYWTEVFATIPEPLDLAVDYPRPALTETAADTVRVPWSKLQAKVFDEQIKDEETSAFVLTMALLVLSLHRLSGQSDIVIGTPLRGRTREEFEKLFGLFINVMPLRFTVDPDVSFRTFLAHVRKVCMDGFAQQDFPFESLLNAIHLPRDESRTPLYTAMLSYQDISDRVTTLPGLGIEHISIGSHAVPTDLVFWMKKLSDRTDMGIDFRTKLWDRASIVSIAEIYQHLGEQTAAHPRKALKDFSIFPAVQTARVMPLTKHEWVGAQNETLSSALITALHTFPNSVIRSGLASFTYRSLLKKASGVAFALKSLGVKAGDRVGLCTDRSIELLEGMVGIILAGAAYVPLDPNAPIPRLKAMAEQADLVAIVTQEEWLDLLPLTPDLCVIVAEVETLAEFTPTPLSKTDPAYVIFTSGSTGTPKAVQISQGAAIHFLEAMQISLNLGQADVCLALTTATFDISVLEIFGSLLQGARLVLADQSYALDGEALMRLIAAENINFMQMTPSGWRILLDSGWTGSKGVQAITGGEALPRDLLVKLWPRVGTLWNAYGPTEATVWATVEAIRSPSDAITIGRALPGYETFVLNAGQLAPIGVWGELHLGGPALADAYLKDEVKTQDRFIEHRLSARGRLYRTGDIVRLRSDGRLEFKARIDTQVKIRGYRIELEEIEAIALRDPRVKLAAAKCWELEAGDQRLVLYIRAEEALTLEDLLTTFRSYLPRYMWPSHLELMKVMPLTPNGKLNRLALPRPEFTSQRSESRPLRLPKSRTELAIAEIWQELLGVKVVSLDDNFFELGGHSLLTLKMLSRMNQSLKGSLKLRDILTANISQIAQIIEETGP